MAPRARISTRFHFENSGSLATQILQARLNLAHCSNHDDSTGTHTMWWQVLSLQSSQGSTPGKDTKVRKLDREWLENHVPFPA